MFCDYRPDLQCKNSVDGSIFTSADSCIWVTYPPGASGDLLISIIDKHYLRTGCEYLGINDLGKVMLYSSDYEMVDLALNNGEEIAFDTQWFYNFANQLGHRNLTYSMLDQIIIGCHLYRPSQIQTIIDNFPQAKIINIYPSNSFARFIMQQLTEYKLHGHKLHATTFDNFQDEKYVPRLIQHERVLNLPFGVLFDRLLYEKNYKTIREFLGLSAPLITFDFIDFYLSKQHSSVQVAFKQLIKTL